MTNIFRYAGFGVEGAFGTTAAATFHIDQGSTSLDTPATPEIIVPTGLGRSPRTKVPGFYAPSGGIDYAWDIETIGWFLRWTLPGGYVYTAGTPKTHELYGTDTLTPQSFTTHIGKDVFEHVFDGCIMNTMTLSVDNGLGQASLGIMAQKDEKDTIKVLGDLTLPADPPMTFANVTAEVNNVDYNAIVKSFNLTINNNTAADTTRTIGSRYPLSYQFGGRDVTCNMSLLFPDTEMLTLFWGNATAIQTTGSTKLPLEITVTSTSSRSMVILLPDTVMEVQRAQPRGRDQLIQEISCRALLTNDVVLADASTVDTDLLITLKNSTTTMA